MTTKEQEGKNNQTEITDTKLLKTIWQGLQDDYRTYCGVICLSEEGQGNA